jgi:hypothetical protein
MTVTSNPICARSVAAATGYVPGSVMAAPSFDDGESIGVLEAPDRQVDYRRALAGLELHALLARQAAIALQVIIPGQAGASGALRRRVTAPAADRC